MYLLVSVETTIGKQKINEMCNATSAAYDEFILLGSQCALQACVGMARELSRSKCLLSCGSFQHTNHTSIFGPDRSIASTGWLSPEGVVNFKNILASSR
mmetsp:Transcript_72256/g.125288  ORF Transcript_72256/g.125288 Transcript_72256/m.125288 type:complete len:99 (-) Transcript_72256:491-787(-)